jgi:hypothetical protein
LGVFQEVFPLIFYSKYHTPKPIERCIFSYLFKTWDPMKKFFYSNLISSFFKIRRPRISVFCSIIRHLLSFNSNQHWYIKSAIIRRYCEYSVTHTSKLIEKMRWTSILNKPRLMFQVWWNIMEVNTLYINIPDTMYVTKVSVFKPLHCVTWLFQERILDFLLVCEALKV